jgi:sarcosine oxidase
MPQVRDVAIIGGGLLGLAAGRALARRDRDVVVLEQAEIGHPASGSKGSCRIFRLGYPDPAYVTAARRAAELWRALEDESGSRILTATPHLTFGAGLDAVHEAMRAAGARCELLSAAAAAERFPSLRVGGPALLEPESSVIAADTALRVLADGVPEIRTGVRVLRASDDGRQVTLQTTGGTVVARTAVISAGPWSAGLLASLGVPLPGRPTLEQVAYLRPARPTGQPPPIFICHAERAPYGLPVPHSSLYKIGIHPSGPPTDPDAQHQSADASLLAKLADVARQYLPGLDPAPVDSERCIYDNTPDEDFVLDRIGNVVIGCGTSGHGFKFGPLFGEWLACLVTDVDAVPAPGLGDRFALDRFRPQAR